MKNQITKQNNGITLIALILTIIVLMILAVVAIGAVNNTGIIQYAQNSADEYKKGESNENITLQSYMDILNEHNPDKKEESNVPDKLVKYLFGDSPNGRNYYEELSEDWETYNKNEELGIAEGDIKGLTNGYGDNEYIFYIEYEGAKYKFKTDMDEDGDPKNTVASYGVVRIDNWDEKSRVGKYVEDENGDTWRIIYDDDIRGLQMVSTNTFKYNGSEICLGYKDTLITDWNTLDIEAPEFKLADLNKDGKLEYSGDDLERAIYSYNQGVETLNTVCENLFKSENGNYTKTYIQDVRCVGSNPVFVNKNSETKATATSISYPALETLPNNNASQEAGLCNGVGYGTDHNFETDFDRMTALGISGSDEAYWMASRVLIASSDRVEFSIRFADNDGYFGEDGLWYVEEDIATGRDAGKVLHCLRPVIFLSSSIQFAEGTDGSEENPYKFN